MKSQFDLSSKQRELFEYLLKEEGINDASSTTITPRDRNFPPPLSFAQTRVWFLEQLQPGTAIHNIPITTRFPGPLNFNALESSLNEIIRRHEVLRTTFTVVEGELQQTIASTLHVPITLVELQHMSEDSRNMEAQRLAAQDALLPFDLSTGPLIRFTLLRMADMDHFLLINMHHIISDGWSSGIFFKELTSLYTAFSSGRPSPLNDLPIQYADFAVWQRRYLKDKVLDDLLSYWKNCLRGAPMLLELPADKPSSGVQTHQGAVYQFELSESLTRKLRNLAQTEGVTLFMVLLSGFVVLLSRFTRQLDMLIGTSIANRTRAEIEGLIGFFVNMLVLRCNLTGRPNFRELVQRIRETSLGAYAHQELPFERLVEELQPERNLNNNPIFQVMFLMQNLPNSPGVAENKEETDSSDSSDSSNSGVGTGTSKFDLMLYMVEGESKLLGGIEYKVDLFKESTMARMAKHFELLLEKIIADPDQILADISLLGGEERQQLLVDWTATEADYPQEKCIHQLFEEQVEKTPKAVALVLEDQSLTYEELDRRTNQVAQYLIRKGVTAESRVVVFLDHSIEMMIALIGTLKAGAAYIPLNPAFPINKIKELIEYTEPIAILTQERLLRFMSMEVPVLSMDSELEQLLAEDDTAPQVAVPSNSLACIYYESHSSGQPLGIQISHQGIVQTTSSEIQKTHYSSGNVGLVKDYSSSFFTTDMWGALLNGAQLTILAKEPTLFPKEFAREIKESKITTMLVNSYVFQYIKKIAPDAFTSLNQLFIKNNDDSLLTQLRKRGTEEFLNVYGMTECAALCSLYQVEENLDLSTRIPIGEPNDNLKIYILDADLNIVPIGIAGELYISSPGLSRGYFKRPALSAEQFIPNPFSETSGDRLYKTGDLARYREDGNLEYLSRLDRQTEVKGNRLDIDEVEVNLLEHESIQKVFVKEHINLSEERILVAFVVPQGEEVPTDTAWRGFLKGRLPRYMIPQNFIVLENIPLKENGEVDEEKLPEIETARPQLGIDYVAPSTPLEEELVNIWMQVFNLKRIGVHDNFFHLGGHSLLATQVMSRTQDACNLEIPLRRLFESPTIAKLAKHIESQGYEGNEGEEKKDFAIQLAGSELEELPISFSQERLWFLDQFYPNSPAYNIPAVIPVPGPLNIKALEDSLNEIIRRHDALRTTFNTIDGTLQQIIAPSLDISLPIVDLESMPEQARDAEAQRLFAQDAQLPFDLTIGPLIRFTLLRLAETNHYLVLNMHHIISDGWSMGIFFQELSSLYTAFSSGRPSPLEELPIQYLDFAVWQRNWLRGKNLEKLLTYWKAHMSGASTILELPTDRPRPAMQTFHGASHYFTVPEHQTNGLEQLAKQEGATLFMVLLSVFSVLLNRYTQQADLLIGSPIANRTRPELEGLIGFFVNMLVLRCDLSDNPEFRQLVHRIREMALGAYAHQDLPFERLVEEIQPERNLSHNPMIQVMFVFQNLPTSAKSGEQNNSGGNAQAAPQTGTGTSKFDLTLFMMEGANGSMTAGFEYNLALFDASTIERMSDHLCQLVDSILADPDQRVSALPLLTSSERLQIVEEWNDTKEDYPADRCIHGLFEEQVAKTPNAIAIESDGEQMTYQELNQRANQLSHYLLKKGVGPEVCVGLCMDRSADMVVSIFGILKAGGAYVPLDPAYPIERLEYMLNDSQASIVLSQKKHKAKLGKAKAKFIDLGRSGAAIKKEKKTGSEIPVHSNHLAYVIYTSGSTGKPKGVAIEHHSAVTLVNWAKDYYNADQLSGVLASTSICFDLSIYEMFTPLSCGGKIVLVENILHLPDCTAKDQVTLINTVPSGIAGLMKLEIPTSVRIINLAGEPLSKPLVQRLYQQNQALEQVINLYGPSEDTTYSTVTLIEKGSEEKVTIGRPIANTQVYILDRNGNPTPVGVVGEIYISGDGLAREYLHKPELTAEKFLPNPFDDDSNSRMYRTGDLARYNSSGNIEFMGRADHQIKLRGFRIELGEIESILKHHPKVEEAVVTVWEKNRRRPDLTEGGADKALIAYILSSNKKPPLESELRSFLSKQLPQHMLPSQWMLMEEFPLMPNGKINRSKLPTPEESSHSKEVDYVAPRNDTERLLVGVWEDVLGLKNISVTANFFELGGHSLLAIKIAARVRSIFKVEFPLNLIFQISTLADLSAQIDKLISEPNLMDTMKEETIEESSILDQIDSTDMLDKIDDLSDEEINSLLKNMLANDGD